MLKITGIKTNNLILYINNNKIGVLDADHNKIYLDYTEKEWRSAFNIDIAFEVANYYYEFEVINGTIVPTVEYNVIFKEEEEVNDYEF